MKTKLILSGLTLSSLFLMGLFYEDKNSSFTDGNPANLSALASSYRLYPGTNSQFQTWIATHPLNSQIMAGCSITDYYIGGYTTGAYITTNGGLNWSGTNSIRDEFGSILVTVGDPSITIDKNGTMIIVFTSTPWPGGFGAKVGIHYSTNNGAFWSQKVYVPGVDTSDKVMCTSDNTPSSPYFGNSYIVYSERRKGGIYFSKSTNGANWDSAKRICPPFKDARTGASISTGPLGEIFVSWPYYDPPTAKNYIGFARSTDGGATWWSRDTAIYINLFYIAHRLNLVGVRMNGLPTLAVDKSGGSRHGNIYIAAMEKSGAGSPALDNFDIILHSSSDNGTTWNPSTRVNQDNTGSLRYQFFPALTIDSYGGVNVFYYDTRTTVTNDSFEVYLSRSVNGGNTFEDFIMSQKFKLKPIVPDPFSVPGYIGTYMGATSSGKTITPFWFDNNTGIYQGWTKPLNVGSGVKVIPQAMLNPVTGKLNKKDPVKVYLRSSTYPYQRLDSSDGVIDSVTFKSDVVFRNAPSGNYYIEAFNKNSIQTWSSTPVNYSVGWGFFYDFTSSSTQAFGEVMVMVNSQWCIYSADVNTDGLINLNDLTEIYNDAVTFQTGNLTTDVTGDELVNLNDIAVCYNNSVNFIRMITP